METGAPSEAAGVAGAQLAAVPPGEIEGTTAVTLAAAAPAPAVFARVSVTSTSLFTGDVVGLALHAVAVNAAGAWTIFTTTGAGGVAVSVFPERLSTPVAATAMEMLALLLAAGALGMYCQVKLRVS